MEKTKVRLEGKDIPLIDLIEYIRKEVEDERENNDALIHKNILFCVRQHGVICLKRSMIQKYKVDKTHKNDNKMD